MNAERSKRFCFFNVNFILKKKETQEFESMKFRTPSILSKSLNLIQAKVDFWGIFRLTFKNNLESGTVLGPNSLCDCRKRDANHRLSQTHSKLDLITSWLHFHMFPAVLLFFFASSDWLSWVPMLLFYENSVHSKSMFSLCFSDTLMMEPMILPFAPFVKSPYGVPCNLRQTSPWKRWRKRFR